ncbi:MAG: carbon starvation protein A, partial [Lachnospiraceae bacterium]|nr:carbon starvation protein A [Lachnospiraceae bacterium]
VLVDELSRSWLGAFGGLLAILGVIAAPITSGDTALRSARLIAADFMRIPQKTVVKRLLVSIPIFALCFVIMLLPYDALWRYFAWCNQVLSVFTLWAATVWLAKQGRFYWISFFPAVFMTCVTVTYIFFAPEGFTGLTQSLFGWAIPYGVALGIGLAAAVLTICLFARFRGKSQQNALLQR